MKPRKRSKWQGNFILVVALASAAVAAVSFFFLTSSFPKDRCVQLYEEWHSYMPNTYLNTGNGLPYPGHSESNALTSMQRRNLMMALSFYTDKDFQLISDYFTKAIPEEELSSHPELMFYYAMIQMELGDIDKASTFLTTLSQREDTFYYADETLWYLALCKLRECEIKEATVSLELLLHSAQTLTFKEKAEGLLGAIGR